LQHARPDQGGYQQKRISPYIYVAHPADRRIQGIVGADRYSDAMSELSPQDPHELIHLGGQAAVVVPLDEYRSLQEAADEHRIDEEFLQASLAIEARRYAGTLKYVSSTEARRRLGLPLA